MAYNPGNPDTYNPTTAVYNSPIPGGEYWTATFSITTPLGSEAVLFPNEPVGPYPSSGMGPPPSPLNAYLNFADHGDGSIGPTSVYIQYASGGFTPQTPGTDTGAYNVGNPATYTGNTLIPPAVPGNANYNTGTCSSFTGNFTASYNAIVTNYTGNTLTGGYNPTNISGYNAGSGIVNWNATIYYEVEKRVSAPGQALEYSVFVSDTNYASGSNPTCPAPASTTNGSINSTVGGLQYYEVDYVCTPSPATNTANYNVGSPANYIGNTENYNAGNPASYTGNNIENYNAGSNAATYNPGNPSGYTGNSAGGYSGNTGTGSYISNNANYNPGNPASYGGNNITGYNAAPPPSYNIGNPATYQSNTISGYNLGNVATYTGNFTGSYSGNFASSYNPGSASTYNFPIPGTPGEPGYAFGVYFPGGAVCAPGTYVPAQEISYYFENQEIDYKNYPVTVPPGGQIVVTIE
jgi:hypothetical protein